MGRSPATTVLIASVLLLAGCDVVAGNLASGRDKAAQCVVCHGRDGIGVQPDAPNLAGQKAFYLREQLLRYRAGTRVHPQMNVIAQGLSDEDIEDLVNWYSNMRITVDIPEDDG